MHPLTWLYTKLLILSNDRSAYLTPLRPAAVFFAGNYEDFCLQKKKKIANIKTRLTCGVIVKEYLQEQE